MWKQSTLTIIMSVLLSISATLIVERYWGHVPNDTVRAKKLELIDERGVVRGVLEVRPSQNGEQQPELTLVDDTGRQAVALGLGPRGRGYLTFGNNDRPGFTQGVITLGYLQLDDTVPHSDSMTGWGLAVGNKNLKQTIMGISDSGQFLGLSSLQTSALNDASRRAKTN